MPVTFIRDPQTGITYSVNIAGDTPTEEENARINEFISSRRQQAFVPAPAATPVEPEDDGTAVGRGLERGVQQVRSLLGTSIEEAGRGFGFEGIEQFGRGMETAGQEELRRLQEETPRTGFFDVKDIPSAATYVGEAFGEQGAIMAQTFAGAGAGALAGSPFGPLGMTVGGVAGAFAASYPLLFGGDVQRQEEQVAAGNLDKVNIERALVAAFGQAALESISAAIIAAAPLRAGVGSLWARSAKGAGLAGATEVPTEITQQLIERAQAGLPIDSPDAIKEYVEAGATALIVSGPIGAVGGALQKDAAQTELDQDEKEMRLEGSRRMRFAEETEAEIEADRQKALATAGIDPDAPLGLDAPSAPLGLPAPESVDVAPETKIADDEFETRSFDRAQYERILQQIKADATTDNPINVSSIHQKVKKDIPETKLSQVKDALQELQSRGYIAENPANKRQKYIPMGKLAPEVKTPDVSYRRQIDAAANFIKADQQRLERLQYDLRAAEAYGRDLDGNRATPNQINAEIAKVEQRIESQQQRIDLANQRLQTLEQDTHVPRIERVGLPPSVKAVPVPEATVEALRPRYEAQQQNIKGLKEQLTSINKQVRKLNDQAKKRRLSSNELDRMQKLQQAQGEVSTRLGEAQANLKTPEKIVQEAKGEQFREQERQREIERKLAAAKARAAADQVREQEQQGRDPFAPAFNAKQDRVFSALKKRLGNLGLKDVNLERGQVIEGAEGAFDPVTKTISLAMGLYDPKLNDQQLFDAISEVMNHEVIHALRAMGVLTAKEVKVLEKAAANTRYVKRTNTGTKKRAYTYLDRAKRIYPDYTETQQKEEAIAEMFRDYVAGRLKIGGGPRALLEKIKRFFKALVGVNRDEGFTNVADIFAGIRRGEVGARERVAPAPVEPSAAPAVQSRMPVTEEDARPLQDIRMPINPNLPSDQVRAQIQNLTNENRPRVKQLIKRIDQKFGTKSGDNAKNLSKVTQKAKRPSILATKPWHDVSHIRDSYRFKTVIDDFRDVPAIFDELLADGISLVKIDTGKLFEPKEWGWRIIAFDLRMPNGQLVEWYLPLKELEIEKKARGHLIFEEWRNKTQEELSDQRQEYFAAMTESYRGYDAAFQAALDRMGISRQEAEASWRSAESSIEEAARNARRSSGVGISSGARASTDLTMPSRVLTEVEPSAPNMMARGVPSSTSAKASAIVSISDDYMPDAPADERPLFSRLPRTDKVAGLTDFIKSNPDGFTISPDTFEPVSGGFVVAPLKEAEIIVGQDLPEEVLRGYIEDNKDIARASGRPVYLGGWFDTQSNQYFLDNTLIVPTLEEALYIAEAADQLAIFNLNNFEEVRTDAGIQQLRASGAYRSDAAIRYQRDLAQIGRRFAEARDQRRARIQEQLTEGLKKPRESRLLIAITPEERAASILDYLNPSTGEPLFKKRPNSETLVSFANKLLELRGAPSYDIVTSEADREKVARIMAAEAEAALLSSKDALGWYDETLKLAKRILFPVYPEISPTRPDGTKNEMHDPGAEHAFDFATAVTSNGLSVIDNYKLAARQYEAWKASEDGKFPISATGAQGGAMLKAFEFWNGLVDQGLSSNQIADVLMFQLPRGAVNNMLVDLFGVERVKDLPIKANTDEEASTIVSMASVVGAKIGNGFYQNLRGNFDPLTMDRWWMRFVNRITGNPYAEFSDSLVRKNVDRVWEIMQRPDDMNDIERGMMEIATRKLGIRNIEKSDVELLTPELLKAWDNQFFKKAYSDRLQELREEGVLDFTVKGSKVTGPDAEAAKKIAQSARPEKPPLALAVNTLASKLDRSLQEDPRTPRDRTAMRDVTNRARDILKNELGVDITNADFQALMWYAEKRIFAAGGVRKGRGDDNDYADGAIAIALSKGISNDKIKATLPEAERGRVSSVASELAGDSDVGKTLGRDAPREEYGNFFAPRELTLVSDGQSIEGNMTPSERADVESAIEGAAVDGTQPPVMYSRMPTDAFTLVQAPVKKDGVPTPIYGALKEAGKAIPVVLPKGNHEVYETGVEVGTGLYHIQQRQHDRELVDNSKYKRVENAIYDIMRRWQDQGYEDGDSVIGYNSRDGFVLEWRNNLGFSAPPLRLVLQRGTDIPEAPIKNVYYVKTFYPLLDMNKRYTKQQRGRRVIQIIRSENKRQLSRMLSATPVTQNTPQFGPSDLETAMQNIRYTGVQETLAKAAKSVGGRFGIDRQSIDDGTQWLFTKLQDNFLSVGKMYDALRKQGYNINRDMDAYFQELLMHGVTGSKKDKFKVGQFEPLVRDVASIKVSDPESTAISSVSGYYKQILEKTGSKSHALANAYLYALHAKERNKRISDLSRGKYQSGSGMSDREADSILAFIDGLDPARSAAYKSIAQQVRDIVRGTNDEYIEGGLIPDYREGSDIDDDTRRAFTKYDNYVPLSGFADPESEADLSAGGFSTSNKFGALGSPDKKALGRESYAGDILANVAIQRERSIDKAERNKVGVAFLNLLESDVETNDYAEVLERHPLRRVMRNGVITTMPDRDFSNPNLPILAVRRGGEEVLIGFHDPRLANAFKSTSPKQMNAVMGGLNALTRFYANMLTTWNPAFLLSNVPRDIETAIFNAQQYGMKGTSGDILKGVAPAFRAIMKVINNKEGADPYWRKRYQQFYDNGGQNVLNQMGDTVNASKDIKKTIERIVQADNSGNRISTRALWTGTKKGGASLINYIEAVNTAAENAIRVSFFDSVMKNLEAQGVPEQRAAREAAAAARQLTTNFAKGGEMKSGINTLYLFFNASLQGSMAMFNALINNPKARALVASVVVAGFVQDMLNGLISDDEDGDGIKDYDNLGDYRLSHSIVLPDLNGDGTFVSIPLAYGINMFYNFGRVMGNMARGAMGDEGTYTPQQAAASTIGTVTETFNPFGGNNFWTFLSPTQLDPVVELMTNKNFMNEPIYKELSPFEQFKSRSGMYWSTTSPSSIWISKFINDTIGGGTDIIPGEIMGKRVDIQPDVIEHVIDFMLGGAGRFVIQLGEAATTYAPAAAMGEFEKDMIRRTPVINKYLTAVTEKDRSGDFYEKRDDVLAVYSELNDAMSSGDRDRVLAIRERYSNYIPIIGPIRAINNEIRKLSKAKRQVTKNPNISDERRREIIDQIDQRIAAYVSRGNKLMSGI